MQGGTPESEDENPAADGPEEADAILAAPSPSAASFSIAPFLFSESNLPHVSSQNPRCAGHLPAPSGASLRYAARAPGPTQGGTIRMAWGTILASHRFSNFNPFPQELLSPLTTE